MSSIMKKPTANMPDLFFKGTFLPKFYKNKDILITIAGNQISKKTLETTTGIIITDEFLEYLSENDYIFPIQEDETFYMKWKLTQYLYYTKEQFVDKINTV